MSVLVKALNNYTRNIYLYKNSDTPASGNTGIELTSSADVVTVYCDVAPSMSSYVEEFELYVAIDEYDYTTLTPVEATPGATGSGLKKAYSFASDYDYLEANGYDVYIVPKSTLATGIDFNGLSLYTTPDAIKDITTKEQGVAELDVSTEQYLEYPIDFRFHYGAKVAEHTKIYFKTISQQDEQGRPILFDRYASAPAGVTQPNLFLDEAEFASTGISINKFPANTYIDMPDLEYGYSPSLLLKFGEAPTTEYTVTFDSNGGSEVASQTVESGETATEPTAPTKAGADFVYWCSDEELTTEYDFDTPVTADITLYAKWNNRQNTVTFKEGDETIATVKVDDLTTVKPIDPKHPVDANGDEFVYWTLNNVEYDFSTPVDNDITLVAYYAQGATDKWIMSLPNCFVGLKSDIDELPIARVENGTKALAISESAGEETAYIFHRASLTWVELQHYSVNI